MKRLFFAAAILAVGCSKAPAEELDCWEQDGLVCCEEKTPRYEACVLVKCGLESGSIKHVDLVCANE